MYCHSRVLEGELLLTLLEVALALFSIQYIVSYVKDVENEMLKAPATVMEPAATMVQKV